MAQCVQESGLQIPAIETEDCLCQIGRNMLGTDPLMRVSNAVEFQRRNRTFSRIPLVTIARKPYILIAIIDTLMLPIGNTVRIRAASVPNNHLHIGAEVFPNVFGQPSRLDIFGPKPKNASARRMNANPSQRYLKF
jgi:hypothetical protein